MVQFNFKFIPKLGQRQVEDLDFRGKLTLKTYILNSRDFLNSQINY